MSVSSSDSQLSSHCEHDVESDVRCDFDLDSKYLSNDENSQCVRYRKKERSYMYVFERSCRLVKNSLLL
jgi:hypothetical protein